MLNLAALRHISAVGECMVEVSGQDDACRLGFGGDTLNTLLYLRRLLSDAWRLRYVTALGDDPLSEAMVHAWSGEGIDTTLVRRLRGRLPGLYLVRTDAGGERSFLYWRRESAARRMLSEAFARRLRRELRPATLLYLSGISVAILPPGGRERLLTLCRDLTAAGAILAFDSNYRPALWSSARAARQWLARLQALADIALVSHGDERAVFGDSTPEACCQRLMQAGVAEVVVKDGPRPAWLGLGAALQRLASPTVVSPRDTTGAGDAFNAAYLAARVSGDAPEAAAAIAQRLAARVIQSQGAIIAAAETPTLEQLRLGVP